ncbi:MAG: HEAT repeat domain-containing protein [Anaerolineales bacterium]|nr:HEAT repeat domain-containing protein [Anaerolineales bacterium]
MAVFGPPDVKKLEKQKNIKGLVNALKYKRSGKEEYRRGKASQIRMDAAWSLNRIGTAVIVPALLESLKEDKIPDVRIKAFEAAEKHIPQLDRTGIELFRQTLVHIFDHAESKVALACVPACAELGGKEPILALARLYHKNSLRPSRPQMIKDTLKTIESSHHAREILTVSMAETLEPDYARMLKAMQWEPEQDREHLVYLLLLRKQQSSGPEGTTAAILETLDRDGLEAAVKMLVAELADQNDPMVNAALDQLGWKPDKSSAGVNYYIQMGDYTACAQLGAAAVPALVDKSPDHLKLVTDPDAIQPLINLIKTTLPKYLRTPVSFQSLKQQAESRKYYLIKKSAVDALINFGSTAVDPLINNLDGGEHDKTVITLLETIGDVKAWHALWKFEQDTRRISAQQQ